jgi:hypothetical protein
MALNSSDNLPVLQMHHTVTDTYRFTCFCVEVLIIRYDKMVSHMTPHVHLSYVISSM